MKKIVLDSDKVHRPFGDYSHGWKIEGGKLIILSGQVPADSKGSVVGPGDLEKQARQVFQNIELMLKAAGATFKDIVKMQVLLTEQDLWQPFAKVRREYLAEPYPATTLFVVKSLAKSEWMIEVEVIAVID